MLAARLSRRYVSCIRTADDTRRSFIRFFEAEGHVHVPSSSVVAPPTDESLLFTNAGMNQFKGVLAGVEKADRWPSRVVTHQKCIRAGGMHNDLDDVGNDLHHLSFFEMMGNWSFNDSYGKEKACKLAWTYLTEVIHVPKDRLYVTYFAGNSDWEVEEDTETRDIWRRLGVDRERILPFERENFWQMGRTGSCGPCTEIHYDRVEGRKDVPELVNRDDSVVELWNIVFTNSIRHDNGTVRPLGTMHVDTGLGLERLVSVVQGVGSNFDTDLFRPIILEIEKLTKFRYTGWVGRADPMNINRKFRRVADHVRAATVALADGVVPAPKGAGAVIRKILRRAAWNGKSGLDIPTHSLSSLVPVVVRTLESAYPELRAKQTEIVKIIDEEEKRLWRTLERGAVHMVSAMKDLKPGDVVSGKVLFRLHDEHGISPSIVEVWADPLQLKLDMVGYDLFRANSRQQSKAADVKKTGVRR